MIISHKHKFIFIRPKKVAGTSIDVALSEFLGSDDIMTPENKYSSFSDESFYNIEGQNYQGFYNHMPAQEVRKRVDKEIWDNYFKFSVVRNPWDVVVSHYFFEKGSNPLSRGLAKNIDQLKRLGLKKLFSKGFKKLISAIKMKRNLKDFDSYVEHYCKTYFGNDKYYFDDNGNPLLDFYIRYENLEQGYKEVCEKFGLPFKDLPRLKTKQRKGDKKPYQEYYNEKTRQMVANASRKTIEYFDYKF